MAAFLANCLHGLEALGPSGLWAVMGALFLAGLAGGASHCAAMCGPFVLAQAAAVADRSASGGVLRRLSGAALAPYHLGRAIGYGLLGALVGVLTVIMGIGGGFIMVPAMIYLLGMSASAVVGTSLFHEGLLVVKEQLEAKLAKLQALT